MAACCTYDEDEEATAKNKMKKEQEEELCRRLPLGPKDWFPPGVSSLQTPR